MIRALRNLFAKPQPSTVEADFDAACDDMQAKMLAMIAECPARRFRSGDLIPVLLISTIFVTSCSEEQKKLSTENYSEGEIIGLGPFTGRPIIRIEDKDKGVICYASGSGLSCLKETP